MTRELGGRDPEGDRGPKFIPLNLDGKQAAPREVAPDFHHGLVEGTPLHFPIPGIELERLGLPNYTFGGVGMEMAAAAAMTADIWVPARAVYRFDPAMTTGEMIATVRRQIKAGREEREYR